jgi:1,2-diacylglycerol 3-beta-galactosyltransferase
MDIRTMSVKSKRRHPGVMPSGADSDGLSRRSRKRASLRWLTGASTQRRVLIFTADAGSGHRSAAHALEAVFQEQYAGRCITQVVNPMRLPGAPSILRTAEENYVDQITRTPEWYQFQYEATDTRFLASLLNQGAAVLLQRPIRRFLENWPPHVIIAVYPLYTRAVAEIGRELSHHFPMVTVVTDLVSVHTAWFQRSVDLCLVPTDAVSEKALQNGMTPQQVKVTGIPVHPRLVHEPADRAALRATLGWDAQRPTALILGGGAGIGPIEEIAEEINWRCPAAQIAIVAGKNETLRQRLESRVWDAPTHIYGFTNQIPALMHAADVLVTKAGGLTVSEGLACGLPMVIHQVTPGQEEGNAAYVETRDAGLHLPSPAEIGELLARWLRPDSAELQYYAANARAAGQPRAAYNIAERAWKLAGG